MGLTATDLVPVVIAGSVGFAVGGLWYAPFAFGQLWLRHTTVSAEDLQRSAALGPTAIALGAAIAQAAVLALVLRVARIEGPGPVLATVLLLWLGFTAAPSFVDALEARRPLVSWLVDAGHRLAAALAMGAVLAFWPG
jgi:hypothetical protein